MGINLRFLPATPKTNDLDGIWAPCLNPPRPAPRLQTCLLVLQEETFEILQCDPLLRSLDVPKGRRAKVGLENKRTSLKSTVQQNPAGIR